MLEKRRNTDHRQLCIPSGQRELPVILGIGKISRQRPVKVGGALKYLCENRPNLELVWKTTLPNRSKCHSGSDCSAEKRFARNASHARLRSAPRIRVHAEALRDLGVVMQETATGGARLDEAPRTGEVNPPHVDMNSKNATSMHRKYYFVI